MFFFCRLEQQEKDKLQSEYFNDFNKDTVKVDKNGNGLNRLWHQMLTMFPLARLETAEAITAKYPTPFSLFKVRDLIIYKKVVSFYKLFYLGLRWLFQKRRTYSRFAYEKSCWPFNIC